MPFDLGPVPKRGNCPEMQQRRLDVGTIRARLRKLEPGQVCVVPWPEGAGPADREDWRRTVVRVAWTLWGAKAASVLRGRRGCVVLRRG